MCILHQPNCKRTGTNNLYYFQTALNHQMHRITKKAESKT